MPKRPLFTGARAVLVGSLLGLLGFGCAHQGPATPATPATGPVTQFEMEPIKITAVSDQDGTHIEAFDAAELFEQGGKALGEKRYDDALAAYDRLLKEFEDGRYTKSALYNAGLALQGKKDYAGAIERFKLLAQRYPDSSDSKDALFQLGATLAETGNWPASAQTFSQILERKDLTADDRLEAMGRRGFAQFQLKDLDTAERTFRSGVAYFHQIEREERLETDFFLALCLYHLGEISHERFRAVALRLPDTQMSADLDEKARLLLQSQRAYIDTMKLGNPEWAAASGFQVGALYEELFDSFIHAPVPSDLLKNEAREKREVYYEELRKKIRVLLEKSSHWYDENLKMMERLGVRGEWREKSKLAYSKVQQLLDPSYRVEFQPPGSPTAGTPGAAPPVPMAPNRSVGGEDSGINNEGAPAEPRPSRTRTGTEPMRQIL
ncbi:MAG TPA: tetratricopeptide repeat protein [Polyangia bacterium]|nr:tetratricopeptide repeat protein [Polyangia bacterium]